MTERERIVRQQDDEGFSFPKQRRESTPTIDFRDLANAAFGGSSAEEYFEKARSLGRIIEAAFKLYDVRETVYEILNSLLERWIAERVEWDGFKIHFSSGASYLLHVEPGQDLANSVMTPLPPSSHAKEQVENARRRAQGPPDRPAYRSEMAAFMFMHSPLPGGWDSVSHLVLRPSGRMRVEGVLSIARGDGEGEELGGTGRPEMLRDLGVGGLKTVAISAHKFGSWPDCFMVIEAEGNRQTLSPSWKDAVHSLNLDLVASLGDSNQFSNE